MIGLVAGGVMVFGDTIEPMPPHAKVVVDDATRTYFAPPYFSDTRIDRPSGARVVTAREARDRKYTPDSGCRNKGYFTQDTGSWIWRQVSSPKSRWNSDGSWNW